MKHQQVWQVILSNFGLKIFVKSRRSLPLRHQPCLLRFSSGMRRLPPPDISPEKTFLSLGVISHSMTKCCRSCKHPQHLLESTKGDHLLETEMKGEMREGYWDLKGHTENTRTFFSSLRNIQWWVRMRYCLPPQKIHLPFISPCLGLIHCIWCSLASSQSKLLVVCFTHAVTIIEFTI